MTWRLALQQRRKKIRIERTTAACKPMVKLFISLFLGVSCICWPEQWHCRFLEVPRIEPGYSNVIRLSLKYALKPFKSMWFLYLTSKNLPAHCICMFFTDLGTNSHYFTNNTKWLWFNNRDGVCLPCGTSWTFKCNSFEFSKRSVCCIIYLPHGTES